MHPLHRRGDTVPYPQRDAATAATDASDVQSLAD
jgi:hypothetical protein